jgi:hypothetical protein
VERDPGWFVLSFAAQRFSLCYIADSLDISGIDVYPPSVDGEKPEPIGKSSRAGALAIGQTAASRVLTNMCAHNLI